LSKNFKRILKKLYYFQTISNGSKKYIYSQIYCCRINYVTYAIEGRCKCCNHLTISSINFYKFFGEVILNLGLIIEKIDLEGKRYSNPYWVETWVQYASQMSLLEWHLDCILLFRREILYYLLLQKIWILQKAIWLLTMMQIHEIFFK